MRTLPLDHPLPGRPHRIYVAVTNHCNRECPWCSTYSSPAGNTFISLEDFQRAIPAIGAFQLQLEGGEPTVHPQFYDMVRMARANPRCDRLILCTNGVVMPRQPERLRSWVARLGTPLTIKLSFNHHLLDRDPALPDLCRMLRDLCREGGADLLFVLNVRLRSGYEDDDRRIREAVGEAGLADDANIFFLQAYGLASNEAGWQPPKPVSDAFTLINPDGRAFGPDLVARSEAMKVLP